MENPFLRHTLATINYRFQKSISTTKADFGNFNIGSKTRTPNNIIDHMYQVLCFARTLITTETYKATPINALTDISEKANVFIEELTKVDKLLADSELSFEDSKPLIQGPFSDILTHIGQIAMLSRLHGAPIKGEDFSIAPINS